MLLQGMLKKRNSEVEALQQEKMQHQRQLTETIDELSAGFQEELTVLIAGMCM